MARHKDSTRWSRYRDLGADVPSRIDARGTIPCLRGLSGSFPTYMWSSSISPDIELADGYCSHALRRLAYKSSPICPCRHG